MLSQSHKIPIIQSWISIYDAQARDHHTLFGDVSIQLKPTTLPKHRTSQIPKTLHKTDQKTLCLSLKWDFLCWRLFSGSAANSLLLSVVKYFMQIDGWDKKSLCVSDSHEGWGVTGLTHSDKTPLWIVNYNAMVWQEYRQSYQDRQSHTLSRVRSS